MAGIYVVGKGWWWYYFLPFFWACMAKELCPALVSLTLSLPSPLFFRLPFAGLFGFSFEGQRLGVDNL